MSEVIEAHILKRYEVIKKLGSGAYGHVWKVVDRRTKEVLALKKIFEAFQHSTDAQRTFREIMFLRQFNHPNIIRMKGLHRAENDKDIYLLFQYMEADLHGVIRQNILNPIHKKCIVYQVVKAVHYLHSAQLIHRDLKPSNVLLNSDCRVKLCDFGLVRSINTPVEDEIVMTEYVATRWYRAPELLLGCTSYTKAVDEWSLGCLIGEMVRGKSLFPGNSTLNQLERILSFTGWPDKDEIESMSSSVAESILSTVNQVKKRPLQEWFPSSPPELVDLISKLLQFDPRKRMTIEEVLRHPYLEDFYNGRQQAAQKEITLCVGDFDRLPVGAYRGLLYELINSENESKEAKEAKQGLKSDRLREKKPGYKRSTKVATQFVLADRSSKNNSSIQSKERSSHKFSVYKPSREKRYDSTQLKASQIYRSISKDRASENSSSISKHRRQKRHSLASDGSQARKPGEVESRVRENKGLNQIIIKVPRGGVNAAFIQYSQYLKCKKKKQ